MSGCLYIVATPIGNLDDISFRAIDTLKSVDLIAAEDTRHSGHLLKHYEIKTPMQTYHDFSDAHHTEKLLELLQNGKEIALISDAGTPLISDPGYKLVKACHERDIKVVPLPGPSAVIAAMCTAGLATDRFIFEGFLPAKQKARKDLFQQLLKEERTVVFYEAPHRIEDALKDMVEVFGEERKLALARELTKTFETIVCRPLAEMAAFVAEDGNQRKGELVLVLEGNRSKGSNLTMEASQLAEKLSESMPPKVAAKVVSEHYKLPKKEVYDYLIALKASG